MIKPLFKSIDHKQIITAAETALYKEGQRSASILLRKITTFPEHTHATKLLTTLKSPPGKTEKLSKEEALATFLDGNMMSKRSYNAIQKRLKNKKCSLLPSYHSITAEKKNVILSKLQLPKHLPK